MLKMKAIKVSKKIKIKRKGSNWAYRLCLMY